MIFNILTEMYMLKACTCIYANPYLTLNTFPEFSEFSEKIFVVTVKGLEPASSCVGDETGYLN